MIKVKQNILNNCIGFSNTEIIDAILKSRNIKDFDKFISPTEEFLIPLDEMLNIEKAKDIVVDGIKYNKKFKILFDVDCDGIMAGSIIYRYLSNLTNSISWCINNGKQHGLANQDLNKYLNCDILIVVDSLDGNIDKYKELSEMGIEVVILDHHDIQIPIVSEFYTLVSSNYNYKNPNLSGAGVVLKFCMYLDQVLNENYSNYFYDLATCGIIADMCDLSEKSMENRFICYQGFNNIINPAIKKIIGSFEFNSTSVSYSIAPLINAAMRTNNNELAAELFLTDDIEFINKYIKQLKECKEQQNSEIDLLKNDLIKQAEEQIDNKVIYIFIDTEADVSGLIGNKLLELYQRPLFILRKKTREIDEQIIEYYGGSSRAIGIDNFRSLCASTELCKAEGHESAFGFEILEKDFSEFKANLEFTLKDVEFEITNDIDIELHLSDIDRTLIDNIKQLNKISGNGFKPISVKVSNVFDYEIGNMSKGKHLVVKTTTVQFIKWNWQGSFDEMEENAFLNEPLEFCGLLDSGWIGRTFVLKMIINDMKVG